jgi:putative ABC transport system permease protein
MIIPKLALRNILGAGLRTWLNVIALSFSFVVIIFLQGIYTAMNEQVERATIDAYYGNGQVWQQSYDPFDPLTLSDAHDSLPSALQLMVDKGQATMILVRPATIYPQGRFRSILLKGISPSQGVISIPSSLLKSENGSVPALIGSRMAKNVGLQKGDEITVQWRDAHGTFDARDLKIVEVMRTPVQEIDNDQIWIPLADLQRLTAMPNHATLVVLQKGVQPPSAIQNWHTKTLDYLFKDIHAMVRSKRISGSILYTVLLFLAMLAIFDTQVLSIFRRKKEMGTLMALGMTRMTIIGLFTVEGALHGVLAALVGAVYGIPLLGLLAAKGWELPQATDSFGIALGERIFPTYSVGLIAGTTILVLVVTTIVSFLPTRKIATLKPTDALRGKTT